MVKVVTFGTADQITIRVSDRIRPPILHWFCCNKERGYMQHMCDELTDPPHLDLQRGHLDVIWTE